MTNSKNISSNIKIYELITLVTAKLIENESINSVGKNDRLIGAEEIHKNLTQLNGKINDFVSSASRLEQLINLGKKNG